VEIKSKHFLDGSFGYELPDAGMVAC
jgi:hypothetical protein